MVMKPKMYLVNMFLVSAMDNLQDLLSRQEESKGMSFAGVRPAKNTPMLKSDYVLPE